MPEYNFYVYRHAEPKFPGKDFELSPDWQNKSYEKWKTLKKWPIQNLSDNVRIITWTLLRHVQTGKWIAEWLWYKWEIISLESLWEYEDFLESTRFINQLPPVEHNIIIASSPSVWLTSKYLWFDWEKREGIYPYLDGHEFNSDSEKLRMNLSILETSESWLIDQLGENILRALIKWEQSLRWLSDELCLRDFDYIVNRIQKLIVLNLVIEASPWIFKINI